MCVFCVYSVEDREVQKGWRGPGMFAGYALTAVPCPLRCSSVCVEACSWRGGRRHQLQHPANSTPQNQGTQTSGWVSVKLLELEKPHLKIKRVGGSYFLMMIRVRIVCDTDWVIWGKIISIKFFKFTIGSRMLFLFVKALGQMLAPLLFRDLLLNLLSSQTNWSFPLHKLKVKG